VTTVRTVIYRPDERVSPDRIGARTLDDLIGRLDQLEIVCPNCNRLGGARYTGSPYSPGMSSAAGLDRSDDTRLRAPAVAGARRRMRGTMPRNCRGSRDDGQATHASLNRCGPDPT